MRRLLVATVLSLVVTPAAAIATGTTGARAATTPPAPVAPVVAPAALPVATSPGGIAFTTTTGTLAVKDGPDGTHLATVAYTLRVPATATAATPAPTIITTHGFGNNKDSNEQVANASFLASHGYVVLSWTAQGFGTSTGCIRLSSLDYDVKDARQLMDMLQAMPVTLKDSKGLVAGMLGGSEGGAPVLLTTGVDQRIRAAAPGRTWNTLRYSLDPNNYFAPGTELDHLVNPQGVFKQEWTSLFFAAGNAEPVQGHGGCPQEKAASLDPVQVGSLPCLGFALVVCQAYADLMADGDATDATKALLERSGNAEHIGAVHVPVLLVYGQSDTLFTLNDGLASYVALQRQGTPVSVIWNDGGHGGYSSKPGECEAYDGKARTAADMDACYLPLRTLALFDRYVRQLPVDTGPGFAWYSDWLPTSATNPPYGSAPAYPAAPMTTFTLSGSSALANPAAPVTAGSASFTNPPLGVPPAYSETANFTGPDASQSGVPIPGGSIPPREQTGQNAAFTSEAFTVDTDVVGTSRLHVRLAHLPVGDLVLFGKVYDVDAAGTATLIRRQVAPARIPSAALANPVDLDLPGLAHRFAKGHSLRVVLASTDSSYRNATAPDQITVTTGKGNALEVPVLTQAARVAIVTQGQAAAATAAKAAAAAKARHKVTAPKGSLAATGGSLPLTLGAGLLLAAAMLTRRGARRPASR